MGSKAAKIQDKEENDLTFGTFLSFPKVAQVAFCHKTLYMFPGYGKYCIKTKTLS